MSLGINSFTPNSAPALTWTYMGSTQVPIAITGTTTSSSIDTSASGTGGVAATVFAVKIMCDSNTTVSQITVDGSNHVTAGFSDSQSNTYTALPTVAAGTILGTGGSGRWFYTLSPTTNVATTWTVSACTDGFIALMQIITFSSSATPVLDVNNQLLTGSANTVAVPLNSFSGTGDLLLMGTILYSTVVGTVTDNSSGGPLSWTIVQHTEANTTGDGFVAYATYPASANITVTANYTACTCNMGGLAIAFK